MQFPDDLSVETFLNTYWQQQPLLIRNAFKADFFPLEANELAGLAMEEDLESRIVLEHGERPWELRHGPFSEQDFSSLPASHWSLLVQDVDKFVPEVQVLLKHFQFIPDWRVDDIMVSYAEDQGSVGPHVDSYDVFLIQAAGTRRWKIGAMEDVQAGYLENVDLQVLKQFSVQDEWLLEPGDVLYLPPGIPHWGVAEGECVTSSVGFRAPSHQEMLEDWSQHLLETGLGRGHFQDPHLSLQTHSAEIDAGAFAQVDEIISSYKLSPAQQRRWFGRLVTRVKDHLEIYPASPAISAETLLLEIMAGRLLTRHPFARFAFANIDSETLSLFVCGESIDLQQSDRSLVLSLCNTSADTVDLPPPEQLDSRTLATLVLLYNSGYLLSDD
ncbi:MAG: cupin domain-containing protein [Pseudomonadota bacterium]|nr:cupin domain-containing protein [Pseudomonadota bacterium]